MSKQDRARQKRQYKRLSFLRDHRLKTDSLYRAIVGIIYGYHNDHNLKHPEMRYVHGLAKRIRGQVNTVMHNETRDLAQGESNEA